MDPLEREIGTMTNSMPIGTLRDHVEAQTTLMTSIAKWTEWTVLLMLIFGATICGLLIWIALRIHG